MVHIDDGKSYDTDILDVLVPEAGAIYIMDRGFFDLVRLNRLTDAGAFFLLPAKERHRVRRIVSCAVDRSTGVICDQIVRLTIRKSAARYPNRLRRIRYRAPESGKSLMIANPSMIHQASVGAINFFDA